MDKTETAVGFFFNEVEAVMTRDLLESAGIKAWIQKDNCGGMYPQMALLHGIKVFVAKTDKSEAMEILTDQDHCQPYTPWTCPACGESNEKGFALCWQCGKEWE